MTNAGHFDFESQTWVRDGEQPPTPIDRAANRKRGRGTGELILLIGGIAAFAVGLLLLLAGVGSDPSGNPVAFATLTTIGGDLMGLGLLLLLILVVIHAVFDIWQRRMREPE